MTKSMQEAQLEFANGCARIFPTMKNPFVSRDKKRETLCKFVDGLSKEAFNIHIPQILTIVNMKEKECKEYADCEAQVDGILEWLPRMKEKREILAEVVKEHRKKYGLKI